MNQFIALKVYCCRPGRVRQPQLPSFWLPLLPRACDRPSMIGLDAVPVEERHRAERWAHRPRRAAAPPMHAFATPPNRGDAATRRGVGTAPADARRPTARDAERCARCKHCRAPESWPDPSGAHETVSRADYNRAGSRPFPVLGEEARGRPALSACCSGFL